MFARIFCFASLVLLACAFTLNASDCRRIVTTGNYVAPVYNTPTYAQHYNYDTVLVPKAFAVQVRPDYFAQPSDEARQAEFARLIAKELYGMIQAGKTPAPAPNAPPVDVTPREPLKAPKSPEDAARRVLDAQCVNCHRPNKDKPDLTGDITKLSFGIVKECFDKCTFQEMPKVGSLNQEEMNAIGEWYKYRKNLEKKK
jgi:hypothetical protein